jgi:hypothetical protein
MGGGPLDSEGEDYLSQLANSVLKKQQAPKPRVQAGASGHAHAPAPPSSAAADPLTPPSSRLSHSSAEVPVSRVSPPSRTAPEPTAGVTNQLGTDGTFAVGTILRFDDHSIAVYKDRKASKEYEVLYVLQPDGRIKAQGIALVTYDLKVLGKLPPEFMLRMQRRGTWDRDEIIFHLSSFDYCALVPQIRAAEEPSSRSSSIVQKLSSPASGEEKAMRRGRWFRIAFGPQEWNAIYWGEDELGSVVIHNTHQRWALMHLDLNRFKDSLVLGDMAEAEVMDKIYEDIAEA